MSNHPWRARTHMFSCPPGCPERKPGCQDHCEQHAKDKAKFDERMALEVRRRELDQYVCKKVDYYKDRKAKCNKHGLMTKGTTDKK